MTSTADATSATAPIGHALDQDGYVSLGEVLSHSQLRDLRAATDELPTTPPEDAHGPIHVDGDRVWRRTPQGRYDLRRVNRLWRLAPAFSDLLAEPSLQVALSDLHQDVVLPVNMQLVIKRPAQTDALPWHYDPDRGQDAGIGLPIRDAVVGVYLDDSVSGSGCLTVIPGSHRWDIIHRDRWLSEARYQSDRMVRTVPAAAGEGLLHHRHLLHGSQSNERGGLRRTVYLHYRPVTWLLQHRDAKRVRGEARWYLSLMQSSHRPDIRAHRSQLARELSRLLS